MVRAMLTKSSMPSRFWKFAYALACYLHNWCPNSLPHQVLYGRPPSIATLYPFGERAIIHVPAVQQSHKLDVRGIECQILKPLLASGGWLLWDPENNQMIHSASAVFPHFQTAQSTQGLPAAHTQCDDTWQGPTEVFFAREERAIDSLLLAKDISIPENLKQALAGPDRHCWEQACLEELQQMKKHGIWKAIEKTPEMKTIGHHWVFDTKMGESGNVEKFKARLVACGDRQQPGIDCTEMYAPTASLMSLRLLLATACLQHWKVCSFDVSRAYLYSPVEETIWMEPPTHFMPFPIGKVLHLQKALYSMKQAGRCWWLHLLGILERLGFASCEVDMSLYVFCKDETIIAIWIHVDDGMIASNSPTAIEHSHEALCSNFEIKWSENMKQIVGLECVFGEDEVTISQNRLTNDILGAYPRKILQRDSPLPPIQTPASNIEGVIMDAMPFRSVIESLTYLVSGSHLDLAFAVNYLARHSMAPMATHWDVLDHLVGYLLKMRGHRIILRPGECALNLWSDAGWGGELERSQSAFMLKPGDTPILRGSKRQTVVALSTCAAEYIVLSDSTQHLVQEINQLTQLAQDLKKMIFCNNQAAVQVLIDNLSCKSMWYLDRACFFVNNIIRKHRIMVRWVNTWEMQADVLTKRLLGRSLNQALHFLGITGKSLTPTGILETVNPAAFSLLSFNHNEPTNFNKSLGWLAKNEVVDEQEPEPASKEKGCEKRPAAKKKCVQVELDAVTKEQPMSPTHQPENEPKPLQLDTNLSGLGPREARQVRKELNYALPSLSKYISGKCDDPTLMVLQPNDHLVQFNTLKDC
ncbi:hypothetical protein O181_044519 [Austropuccinia psidii MF-1]|uniref:Reverse transcriptase Ty1/copia-type domain-containing protein n=1 Tax=Austropuccinia psidii MF-1 TaxID=1389203 RepID=A0A9Q3HJH1_9BASI|nr:hypothetical protein [Austropuccinia psidii MF-1]